MKITYSMDTLISVSFGTKICTDIFGVEIHMNTDKFVWVGISDIPLTVQHSCHQPQELLSCLYAPSLEKDLTQAVSAWICISGRYSLPKSIRNLASMYKVLCGV